MDSRDDGGFNSGREEAEFYFDPVGLHLELGDVFEFEVPEDHEHTIPAFSGKYELPSRGPDVAGFSSSPIVGEESWLFRFETPERTASSVCRISPSECQPW